MDAGTDHAINRAARESYGRLLAFLASRSRDVAAAEDALADALGAALEAWPSTGVPDEPDAWLLTAARRRLIDGARRVASSDQAISTLRVVTTEASDLLSSGNSFPDERLKLLFVCAHPGIEPAARTPLMLQTVLGLDAARIASAFVVQPAAMGQRLIRAKAKIRDSSLAFEVPEANELPPRLDAVLEAIYAAYGRGWDDVAGVDPRRTGLTAEAVELCRMLLRLMPGQPEVLGLLALMLHCEARRGARRTSSGEYVPLSAQDVSLWSAELMEEAERHLNSAAQAGQLQRFQLEAAIQSAHSQRAVTGRTDWEAIALIYEGLIRLAPTVGARVGQAAATAEALGDASGWALLQTIPNEAVRSYQPYWAVAAHLLKSMRRLPEAAEAYDLAVGLCEDSAMRAFLMRQRSAPL